MTDRELLELAAKAAGYKLKYSYKKNGFFFNYGQQSEREWNPLKDDGDALRLAVNLGIQVACRKDDGVGRNATASCWAASVVEDARTDKYVATRRAIVRAAAEIGKGVE